MTTAEKTQRTVSFISQGQAAMDGDGVRLTRIIGTPQLDMLDPFLMLDCFESDNPDDYIGGFPSHPHRGFETVTYLLAGRMRHQDSVGNNGVIEPGGVQWMTAGKGIIHSEMPEQENGLLKGFQLWVNLPASDKMTAPSYQEFTPSEMALEDTNDDCRIRVISGKTNKGTLGPVINNYVNPTYLDVELNAKHEFFQDTNEEHNAFVYVIEGDIQIGDKQLSVNTLAILSRAEQLAVKAVSNSRFLFIAARPLNEPVARSGPFVMNTHEQLVQAYNDFRSNNF